MLRSHNLALCGWVNMKLKLDMYIENDIHIKPEDGLYIGRNM